MVLRNRDENAEFNAEATRQLAQLCYELDIPYGFKDEYIEQLNQQAKLNGQPKQSIGRTELGRITANANGLVHGTTLQIPTTGYHTMDETASIEACQAFLTVLKKVAELD